MNICITGLLPEEGYCLLDELSVLQEAALKAMAKPATIRSQWSFAEYLDAAALVQSEKASSLYKRVVASAATFVAIAGVNNETVQALAEQSWAYGELVEAELLRDETELTLEVMPVLVAAKALEQVSRKDCCVE